MKKKAVRTKKPKVRIHPILAKWYKYFGWKKPPLMIIEDYPKVKLADNSKTVKLESYIDKVVTALGHKEAMVTDESYISDFLSFIHHEPLRTELRTKELAKAKKKLKIDFSENELVINVAKRLKVYMSSKNEK